MEEVLAAVDGCDDLLPFRAAKLEKRLGDLVADALVLVPARRALPLAAREVHDDVAERPVCERPGA